MLTEKLRHTENKITNAEPRLMVKIDRTESLPNSVQKYLMHITIKRKVYALVKDIRYHN